VKLYSVPSSNTFDKDSFIISAQSILVCVILFCMARMPLRFTWLQLTTETILWPLKGADNNERIGPAQLAMHIFLVSFLLDIQIKWCLCEVNLNIIINSLLVTFNLTMTCFNYSSLLSSVMNIVSLNILIIPISEKPFYRQNLIILFYDLFNNMNINRSIL